MSEFVSVERIASLKSGIEAKTGGSYGDLTEGVQALMDGYGSGGTCERTAWWRPPDMPDYDVLIPDKSIFEDDYPDQVNVRCFFTIDTKIPNMTAITPNRTEGTFEIGHFENGEFIADESITFPYEIPQDSARYLILRHIHSGAVLTPSFPFAFSSKPAPDNALSPIVEMYGRVNGIELAGGYSYNVHRLPSMRYITLWGECSTYTLAYSAAPNCAEYIDVSHATIKDVSGRMYETSSPFANNKNVHTLIMPTNRKIATTGELGLQYARFKNNWNLTELDASMWDVANITGLQQTFYENVALFTLNISGWDMSACTNTTNLFGRCYQLTNLITDGAIFPSVSFSLSDCTKLSVDSLNGIIAALPTLAEGTTATLTLGATNTAKLTEAELAVATEKGWTVA